jgi:hypothetical protein
VKRQPPWFYHNVENGTTAQAIIDVSSTNRAERLPVILYNGWQIARVRPNRAVGVGEQPLAFIVNGKYWYWEQREACIQTIFIVSLQE